jgi:hypothetical protein
LRPADSAVGRRRLQQFVQWIAGALIWMPDIRAWRATWRDCSPRSHLFVDEAHPMVPLYAWNPGRSGIRPDRRYFNCSHVNDTYPSNGAVEWR